MKAIFGPIVPPFPRTAYPAAYGFAQGKFLVLAMT
jgi:hypothetical protein